MRKGTVTGEVKMIVKELGLDWRSSYSDNRVRNRIGVKLVGTYLTDVQKEIVRDRMVEKGYTFHYIRENNYGWMGHCDGTRFCFTKN